MNTITELFPQRLCFLMKNNNETTYSISNIVNLSPATISRYMTATMKPKLTTLRAFATYFNVSDMWLMGYDVPMETENNNINILYKRIKERRERLHLSQDDLAKMMGYKSRSSINKIEMGETDIPESKLFLLSETLKVSVNWLLGQGDINNIERVVPFDEEAILSMYQSLNNLGKEEILKRTKELARLEEYQERVI